MATSQVEDGFKTAYEIIKEYRTTGDLQSAFNRVFIAVVTPIKYISYFLGHQFGIQKEDGDTLDVEQFGVYSPFINAIQDELQKAWDTREQWDGLNGLNGLLNVMLKIFSSAGMDITLDYSERGGSSYVNFPYTPQTLPGIPHISTNETAWTDISYMFSLITFHIPGNSRRVCEGVSKPLAR
jgi:hypothetical protein